MSDIIFPGTCRIDDQVCDILYKYAYFFLNLREHTALKKKKFIAQSRFKLNGFSKPSLHRVQRRRDAISWWAQLKLGYRRSVHGRPLGTGHGSSAGKWFGWLWSPTRTPVPKGDRRLPDAACSTRTRSASRCWLGSRDRTPFYLICIQHWSFSISAFNWMVMAQGKILVFQSQNFRNRPKFWFFAQNCSVFM